MKKQIDFDHTLIGKEGITVERRDGVGIDFLNVYVHNKYPILVIKSTGHPYYLKSDGAYDDENHDSDLLMFREVTEMSGYKWAINEGYDSSSCRTAEYAFNAGKQHIKELHNL
jgi:hypothetical protein